MVNKEKQKAKAIEFMKKLGIYKPYIDGFDKQDKVCFFDGWAGFWVDQEPEILNKMRQIEAKYNCRVYAITHEFTALGEMYDFLLVTAHPSEWKGLLQDYEGSFYAFAYVWNKDVEFCSELGDVVIRSFGGGIRRVA